ncbi:MAG: hypothetical protein J6W11_04210 [Alphaproteobacteria bacterium]|nr:hypothetical protein [Alphaproteobacteria bacterium]
MKKFILALMLWPACSMALCLDFYLDENGQSQSVKCGSNKPETKCINGTYWNGTSCQKIKIIQICESQGGTWKQVQLRVAQLSDAFKSGELSRKRAIINMCVCPNQQVWDGQNCRSDIPPSKQCTAAFSDKSVRMTEEFFGSDDCPRLF